MVTNCSAVTELLPLTPDELLSNPREPETKRFLRRLLEAGRA